MRLCTLLKLLFGVLVKGPFSDGAEVAFDSTADQFLGWLSLYAISPPFSIMWHRNRVYCMNTEHLRSLYPNLSENELEAARHNLEEFVLFVAEMCELREAKAKQELRTRDFDSKQIEQ